MDAFVFLINRRNMKRGKNGYDIENIIIKIEAEDDTDITYSMGRNNII
ncbi:hypothetical protein EV214_1462 [Marinisporobacter balticus]|uniref:Uncharacterized protein n=1 Tax=Marinisporobacter balticus TaxID=2018667 RepID=A0A4R2KNV5_9FIRM|nr:hypothetical protein EV214_1462 [Marinisporobacter balticus]